MGWLLYVFAAIFIVAGVLMLLYPKVSQELDERRNARYGFESRFGSDYEDGLKGRAFFVIGIGILIALVPVIAP